MNDELMDKIIEKCKDNPELAMVFDHLMSDSQAAAVAGFTMDAERSGIDADRPFDWK